jgi:hypothetical protein
LGASSALAAGSIVLCLRTGKETLGLSLSKIHNPAEELAREQLAYGHLLIFDLSSSSLLLLLI